MLTELSWFSLCFMCHFYLAARFGLSAPGMEWGSVKEGGGKRQYVGGALFFSGWGVSGPRQARPSPLCGFGARKEARPTLVALFSVWSLLT